MTAYVKIRLSDFRFPEELWRERLMENPKRQPQSYTSVQDYLISEGDKESDPADSFSARINGKQQIVTAADIARHSTPLEMARWLKQTGRIL